MAIPSRLRIGSRGVSRAVSLAVWALAAGCAVHWGLQLGNPGQAPLQVAASGFTASADARQMALLLGHSDAAPSTAVASSQSSRYDLLGVVRHGDHGGAAIISVDGRPARAYLVGREVGEPGAAVRLSSVGARSAVLVPQQGDPITLRMKAFNEAQALAAPLGLPGSGELSPPSQPLPAAPMPEGASGVDPGRSVPQAAAPSPRLAATSGLKPGVMRLQSPEASSAPPATPAALRHVGSAVSNASAYGTVN